MAESTPLNSIYDGDPAGYDQLRRCWLNTRRSRFIAARLRDYSLAAGALVLEIGSGAGRLLHELSLQFTNVEFIGIEPQQEYVDYAAAHLASPNARFVCGRAEDADRLVAARSAVILSNDVLHHVESLQATVARLTRIATVGCRWLAIEPNCLNPYAFMGQALKTGERNFWPSEFLRATGAEGWRCANRRYIFAIPPSIRSTPPVWLQKLEESVEKVPIIGGGVCLELLNGSI